jgi:hypothetical protein
MVEALLGVILSNQMNGQMGHVTVNPITNGGTVAVTPPTLPEIDDKPKAKAKKEDGVN